MLILALRLRLLGIFLIMAEDVPLLIIDQSLREVQVLGILHLIYQCNFLYPTRYTGQFVLASAFFKALLEVLKLQRVGRLLLQRHIGRNLSQHNLLL